MKLFLQSAAENDILIQFEWHAKKALFDIARRFRAAVNEAVKALIATPAAGALRRIDNPRLTGLRTWPVNGFDEFKVYLLRFLTSSVFCMAGATSRPFSNRRTSSNQICTDCRSKI